jgi:murein DD-endopeptidase MepM/ murein hydrolase activator NlpD
MRRRGLPAAWVGTPPVKVLVVPALALITALAMYPLLIATGDNPGVRCVPGGDVAPVVATIRALESGGDYRARAAGSSASGAYQFLDSTWAGYGGYAQAWQAPAVAQDAKAAEHVRGILDAHGGDVTVVPVVWYVGHLPGPGSGEWDRVPAPDAGNVLTPRQYQQHWLERYHQQLASAHDGATASTAAGCVPGAGVVPLAYGFAYPAPLDLFASADVDEPHDDYPAWDWGVPVGTPIYAVRGGRVAAVQFWPYNWWDHGCGQNQAGCEPCGIGVTIDDDTGTRWVYCHGSARHVAVGDTVPAGALILSSGNTGRSSGPHLHLQVRTPDGQLRCPQPLLRSLRDHQVGVDPSTLPTTGCSR